MQAAQSSEELRSLVQSELEIRFECGYPKPIDKIELSDKDELMKAVWLHYVFFVPHAELEQLKKGFRETLQMELLVCLHPHETLSFLVASSNFEVSSEYLLESLVINYSEQGCNKRTAEEAIILHWSDYISDCVGTPVSLGDILQFMSGCSKLPAAGFNSTPSICFTDDVCLPRVSTCALTVTFPRSLGLLSYDEFKNKMDMCIRNSCGFGVP